jgi:hypothetical protein
MMKITAKKSKAEREAQKQYNTRKQWFIERIGKRVFRTAGTCTCDTCQRVEREGLLIEDNCHAVYLVDVEGCSGQEEGVMPLRYFDTPEEVVEYAAKYKAK